MQFHRGAYVLLPILHHRIFGGAGEIEKYWFHLEQFCGP
jgi:hypothetical protein